MKTIDIEKEPLRPLVEFAKELGEEVFVFTSNKQPVAAMVLLKGSYHLPPESQRHGSIHTSRCHYQESDQS